MRPEHETEELIQELEAAIAEGDEQALEEVEEEAEGRLRHEKGDHAALKERNAAVMLAALLFLTSFFCGEEARTVLRGIGYFFGAAAYFSELRFLTDGFTERVPHREAFMAYCFGPLYILMGVAYLLE